MRKITDLEAFELGRVYRIAVQSMIEAHEKGDRAASQMHYGYALGVLRTLDFLGIGYELRDGREILFK